MALISRCTVIKIQRQTEHPRRRRTPTVDECGLCLVRERERERSVIHPIAGWCDLFVIGEGDLTPVVWCSGSLLCRGRVESTQLLQGTIQSVQEKKGASDGDPDLNGQIIVALMNQSWVESHSLVVSCGNNRTKACPSISLYRQFIN